LDVVGINWGGVAVATVVYFALGGAMFSAVTPIGRAWVTAADYRSPTSGLWSGNLFYLAPALTCFVSSVATALLVGATGTDTLSEGIVLGLVVGLGYGVAILLNIAAFEFAKPRRWHWGVIDAMYHGVGLLLSAVILALLR
jgi:hypothetical protein